MFPERALESMPSSERQVFDALRRSLDDEYVVFHSVPWHGRGKKPDGEADFLIAHPDLGLLVLEVKGGGILVNPKTGAWLSEDRAGELHPIKDPFEQALAAKHELIADIRSDARWPDGRSCQIGYGVVLPNVTIGPDRLSPRAKPEITFDRPAMAVLGERVTKCLRHWRIADPAALPKEDGVAALLRMYGTTVRYRIPLSDMLADDEQRIIELTEQHFAVLDLLDRRRRAAIAGCAGSGKTLLAFEKARRLAESGRKVLMLTFNRSLAGYLRERMAVPERLDIRHFHGLCRDLTQEAGLKPPADAQDGDAFVRWLPEGLFEALPHSPTRYDAIVVDEGQDFEADWFDILEGILQDRERGHYYVFYDDNQRLYSTDAIPGWLDDPFQLTVDCRNTNQIGQLVRGLYRGPGLRLSGVDGRAIVYFPYPAGSDNSHIVGRVTEALGHLRKAGANPNDVTVLSPRRNGQVWRRRDFGEWRLYSAEEPDGNVFFETIHGFKGQESRIVVLVELEMAGAVDQPGDDSADALLYVGSSRATTQLAIVSAQPIITKLRSAAAEDPASAS